MLLITMFLCSNSRKKDGKDHRYFSIVENQRVSANRTVQRTVCYLGEINDKQQAEWRKSLSAFDEDSKQQGSLRSLFPGNRQIPGIHRVRRCPVATGRGWRGSPRISTSGGLSTSLPRSSGSSCSPIRRGWWSSRRSWRGSRSAGGIWRRSGSFCGIARSWCMSGRVEQKLRRHHDPREKYTTDTPNTGTEPFHNSASTGRVPAVVGAGGGLDRAAHHLCRTGAQTDQAAMLAVCGTINPVLTILMASVFLDEPVTATRLAGAFLAGVGLISRAPPEPEGP